MIRLNEKEFTEVYSISYYVYNPRTWQRDWVDYSHDPELFLNNELLWEGAGKFVDGIRNAEKLKTMKAVIQSL